MDGWIMIPPRGGGGWAKTRPSRHLPECQTSFRVHRVERRQILTRYKRQAFSHVKIARESGGISHVA